ncbi:MAG: acyltransferase [Bacteroidales bacterium]|nr:acyltransferase [Bacteroidales bacterium]
MKILESYYRKRKRKIPYYAKYSIWLIFWKPIRKYFNVVIIPNIPFNSIRIGFYRLIGFRIGKKTFIGMKCYLDDIEPKNTTIGSGVTISYGCYFALHGKGQTRLTINVKDGAYIGMRCNIISGKDGLIIGKSSIIGAGSLVNKSVPDGKVAVGVPAKVLSNN